MIITTSSPGKYLPLAGAALMFVLGITMLAGKLNSAGLSEIFLPAFFLIMVIIFTVKFLKAAAKIEIKDNSDIVIKTVIGTEYTLGASEFVSIIPGHNMTLINTSQGNFIMIGNVNRFSEFILQIKNLNPGLITKSWYSK